MSSGSGELIVIVALFHAAVADDAAPDEKDTLAQVEALREALRQLGHTAEAIGLGLDAMPAVASLERLRPEVVFNLVESVNGWGRMIASGPALLECLGLAYTGAPLDAMFTTSNKRLAKERMRAAGIPTPDWYDPNRGRANGLSLPDRVIVKSVWEHASIGLDEDAVVTVASEAALKAICRERAPDLGGDCFAERYIEGREFNLGLLSDGDAVRVLPPAEIIFDGYRDRLAIVGYRAKWMEDTYEFHHTPRRFDFPPEDAALIDTLVDLSRRCWDVFGLAGYARVDFRVDVDNRPTVLEINANPCLSPDAGFAAALDRAGIPFGEAVARILADAQNRRSS